MLAKLIRKYLSSKGISQRFLAEKSGYSEQIISAMLTGRRKIVTVEYFVICKALGVPLDTFDTTEAADIADIKEGERKR